MSNTRALFFYGTLRHRPLLQVVLGDLGHLTLREDSLPGYAVQSVAEGPFPAIVQDHGGTAAGVLVEGLRDEDIARLDFYEAGFDFALIEATLKSGSTAKVYLPTAGAWTYKGPWDLAAWEDHWGQMSVIAAQEVMGYFGHRTAREIAGMFGAIRTRAWSQVNALNARHGAGTFKGRVEILARTRPYANFFAFDEIKLRHELYDGTMSPELDRGIFVGFDAAILLPYDPVRDCVLVIEQIRLGPVARGDDAVWQFEPIAGLVDPGETPQDTARREAVEEAGLEISDLYPVAETYASPGGSTDFHYIYVGIADLPSSVSGVAGLEEEGENIRSHVMTFDALMDMCDTQRSGNGPLVQAAYWLARHRASLRAKA